MAVLFRPWVLALVTIGLLVCLLTSADGFRLRDFDVDEDQRTTMEASRRKIQYRKLAVDEVVKKRLLVEEDDENEDDDDDDDEEVADDDEDEEREAESKYKFEKVRRSYRASPKQKRETEAARKQLESGKPTRKFRQEQVRGAKLQKIVQQSDDDDDDDDEDEEDDESEQPEKSIFNLFGLLGSKKPLEEKEDVPSAKTKGSASKKVVEEDDDDDDNDDDETESDSWLDKLKDLIGGDSDKDDDNEKEDPEDDEKSGGIIGWLKSLTEKDDDDGDHDGDKDDDDNEDREKENPLINLFSTLLNSDKEESSEEIKFRPIGDEDDDDSSSSKENAKKPKKDSKFVQMLNQSPLNSLFKSDDLPEEASISTDPKKVKKLQQTPSKVVKQRIEISPEDFESLLLRIPSFVPDYSRLKNNECRRQGQIFQRQLRGKRLWALQMIDASAKVTSGLLRGNANQLGDYDLCTGIATKVKVKEDEQVRMRGKYCLAHVDVVAEDDDLKLPVHLLQGRGFIKSTLNDVSRVVYDY